VNTEHRTSNTEHRTGTGTAPASVRKYDLEERLLEYAAAILRLCDRLPRSVAGAYVAGQLVRSGVSPLYNHGEAESAESSKDFIHKLKICLKELRESYRALRLIRLSGLIDDAESVGTLLSETDELIRIFVASIRTAQSNMTREAENPDEYGTSKT
jgi:four helix bundle protein